MSSGVFQRLRPLPFCGSSPCASSPFPQGRSLGFVTLVIALSALLQGLHAGAQSFRVLDIDNDGRNVVIHHESETAYYYLLRRINLKTGSENTLGMAAGVPKVGRLQDPAPLPAAGYYRVTRVPNNDPLDSDNDGIDDVYELNHPPLSPLNPNDAGLKSPTGATYLDDYYKDESNLYLYPYLVGRGMHDVTGPAADGGMMGYADGDQKSAGIHDRQWARAFIAAGRDAPDHRVVFVVVDAGQVFHSITQGVNERLQADEELKKYYSFRNIVLSATHTHGGAGGHSHHVLYNASIGGFAWQTYDAMVHGIYMAIKKAHRDLAPGRILMNQGQLDNANENREPDGFITNIEHTHPALGNPFGKDNRDTEMLCLRLEHSNRREIGMFNWFPVHGVSFSKENRLLTGDNKGYAAYLFEQDKGTRYPGNGRAGESTGFVAGFANSNPGDLTANRRTLEPGGWPENGKDDDRRAAIIGTRQFEKAKSLYTTVSGVAGSPARLFGTVDYRHMYVAMTSVVVNPPALYPYNVPGVRFPGSRENPPWSTYMGALGIDFTRGTLDGEALPQAALDAFRALNEIFVDDAVTREFERWHYPKEVILTTGTPALEGMTWTPQVLPISILRIGRLAILSVPGEFTSMAGSRLRKTVESILGPDTHAIIAGLANDYSGYITTYEEYLHQTRSEGGFLQQGYEAASTQFGAFTLAAYQTKFTELAESLVSGRQVASEKFPFTFGPFSSILKAGDPILDLPPLPQARPAEYKGQAGCPEGQFWDVGTGYCWSCPAGYNRTIFSVQGNAACEIPGGLVYSGATQHGQVGCAPGQIFDLLTSACWTCPSGYNRTIFPINMGLACERPAFSDFAFATQHGQAGCGPGQFYDLLTGACWSCPASYNRTIFPVTGANACERPAYSEFLVADSARGTGFFGTDCPSGYVFDFIIGSCFRCPAGSAKFIFRAWNDPAGACERVIPAAVSSATRFDGLCPNGQFLDIGNGYCWSCPQGFNRTIFPVTWGSACEKVTPIAYAPATRFDGVCPNGQFWDLGTGLCWSCPGGYTRTIFPVTHGTACERFIPAVQTVATRFGRYACEDRGEGWFLDLFRNECWSCNGWTRNLNPVNGPEACTGPLANFGDLVIDPVWLRPESERLYRRGQRVEVSFWGGHPKNVFGTVNERRVDALPTFLEVQNWTGSLWETIRTDADWDTTFHWERVGLAASKLSVKGTVGLDTRSGWYRIVHRGFSLDAAGKTSPYVGVSPLFQITD